MWYSFMFDLCGYLMNVVFIYVWANWLVLNLITCLGWNDLLMSYVDWDFTYFMIKCKDKNKM